GYILKDKAVNMGILEEKILVTDKVKNTYEESVAVLKLVPKNTSIILVTSAFHMKRSKYLFEKQGFNITPFPVDFNVSSLNFTFLDFIPSVSSLQKTSTFIRENIGRLYYKIIL
ncbi:YdcF family protein, partial [Alphaproteobacteria bacterium]|nr:YdcF family protein [Alphaproteobacteria bacterium]